MPRRLFPLPYPHFMAFAPLDAWARMLLSPVTILSPRYWPRFAFSLFTSALGTALTLPERLVLAPILFFRGRRTGLRLNHEPGALVILGYFRSGTTHLHYLLSCDPRFRTPTWCETLAPQGWLFSWSFLRIFMIPFLSATRPQDDVAIGPEWPAEDDFACNNWNAASSLPSRFVIPSRHAYFSRFHDLARLAPAELNRWRRVQWAFLQKLAWLSPSRSILLKSPSHTARVAELSRMLGPGARFVHISRDPAAVIKSNVTMAQRFGGFHLEDPPPEALTRERVVEEYLASEEKYLAECRALAPGRLVEIRYEDLVADPMGTLRLVYDRLELRWSDDLQTRALTYLTTVRDYRAANQRDDKAARDAGAPARESSAVLAPAAPTCESTRIAALVERFGHNRPAADRRTPPVVDLGNSALRTRRAMALMVLAAILFGVAWLAQAWLLKDRHDWLAWPLGVVLGFIAIRVARVGTTRLGFLAAALTLLVYAATALPATFLMDYGQRTNYFAAPGAPRAFWNLSPWIPTSQWEWYHIKKSARVGALATNNLFWLFMGLVTAYRFASRKHVTPPGRG